MEYKLKVFDIWEFGQRVDKDGNPHQEDSLYPQFGKATDADRLFILCDGMGGHDAGEVASATVCEEMGKSVSSALNAGADFSRAVFDNALDAAFKGLDAKDAHPESKKKMGTTMTFLMLSDDGAFVAHIGDSRVYHIRPGKDGASTLIAHKTYDHSLVNNLVSIGELTPEQAKTFPQKNVLTRAMQPHLDRRPKADVYTTADVRPGDYFYMCSDGMLEDMDDSRICEIFSEAGGSDDEKLSALKNETKDNQDNHTAFVVHILDVVKDEKAAEESANEPIAETHNVEMPQAATIPAIERNAPVTAQMARKRDAKSAKKKWLFLGLLALLAIIVALISVFAAK
ncbi:MAG: protein phosphatase 2C domain-containing protein [Clostridium sp.]|nr:protein phosphatase 2C domain-containing protein [Clostridium sp.]